MLAVTGLRHGNSIYFLDFGVFFYLVSSYKVVINFGFDLGLG